MEIAIIGGGHIGGACALGLQHSARVTVTARSASTLEKFKGTGILTTSNNEMAAAAAAIVMFCVKTDQMEVAVDSVRSQLKEKLVVCMAAQVPPQRMQELIGEGIQLAYVIPNTAAALSQSMTFISNVSASAESMKLLEQVFSAVGKTAVVPMEMLAAGIKVASCGIGYALNYIAAASRAAQQLGFSREQAIKTVTQTVLGAALVQEASAGSPEDEVRKVATPGGLTRKGVDAMEKAGFSEAVKASVCPE